MQLKLQRSTSTYAVRFIGPAVQADAVELGGWYKVAILPDGQPDATPSHDVSHAAQDSRMSRISDRHGLEVVVEDGYLRPASGERSYIGSSRNTPEKPSAFPRKFRALSIDRCFVFNG